MKVEKFDIEGPLLFTPHRHGDDRGFFSETFRLDAYAPYIGNVKFVQDNHTKSVAKHTLRGLHYQSAPRVQGKLVRVTRGAVFDVAVDARPDSPTRGRHVAVELSESNWRQLWVPAEFLHGFLTLRAGTELLYKVTDYYSPDHDGAVAFDDPDLAINWPLNGSVPVLSDKDRRAPRFSEVFAPLYTRP